MRKCVDRRASQFQINWPGLEPWLTMSKCPAMGSVTLHCKISLLNVYRESSLKKVMIRCWIKQQEVCDATLLVLLSMPTPGFRCTKMARAETISYDRMIPNPSHNTKYKALRGNRISTSSSYIGILTNAQINEAIPLIRQILSREGEKRCHTNIDGTARCQQRHAKQAWWGNTWVEGLCRELNFVAA